MDAFPSVTIIAHTETKKSMDLFGTGSADREARTDIRLQKMLDEGKGPDGRPLTPEEKSYVKEVTENRRPWVEEVKKFRYQGPTVTFDHDFSIDLGGREVQVKFLGRGNTGGDAVAYLPKEKIAVAGDLVVWPLPYVYDGYPSEWIQTLQNLAQLDADTIIPGHGPIFHDKTYVYLVRDLLKS